MLKPASHQRQVLLGNPIGLWAAARLLAVLNSRVFCCGYCFGRSRQWRALASSFESTFINRER